MEITIYRQALPSIGLNVVKHASGILLTCEGAVTGAVLKALVLCHSVASLPICIRESNN